MPDHIEIRGARVHNLRHLSVDIPLHQIVGVAGVSGSGKSSLALGVVYAEGSRRYLEALSTYTRRRLTQASAAAVDEALHVPAALALHQRPGVPGMRSTFGTGSELLNSLRLIYSRLASHRCPNGHQVPPSIAVAAGRELTCPECGATFMAPSAEELSFNSTGACPHCDGTGKIRVVDESTLVPDEGLSIDEGAVAPWQTLMWSLMKDIARDNLHIRTNVPFRDLTPQERELVFHGAPEKYHMLYHDKAKNLAGEMDFTYFNAVYTVENALAHVKDEKGMKRVERFLKVSPCPHCGGTRLSPAALAPRVGGLSLGEATALSLERLIAFVEGIPGSLPSEMRPMASSICDSFLRASRRLVELGLSYLTLDRETATLSTGERQRMQLARAVRNRTTGVLYVLDEPSIGLHPQNLEGVAGVMDDLILDGNSVLLVDHDLQLLSHADHLIELGPGAGKHGGSIVAQGPLPGARELPGSIIGPYLSGKRRVEGGPRAAATEIFAHGAIEVRTRPIHTVKALTARFPQGRMTAVTGVSGSGKTTLVLECLIPALQARAQGLPLPAQVESLTAPGITRALLIDATPIGINVRSTVATYAEVHDELRKAFARTEDARKAKRRAGDFSYNTGRLRCPECDGTGEITLDVQFLPDVKIPCPACQGGRYAKEALAIRRPCPDGVARSLPGILGLSVEEARAACADLKPVERRLGVLCDLGLGYLGLGEDTPRLSGGEAQRLKLASEMGRGQQGSVFVFDEPTIGLHPQDVEGLLGVFRSLTSAGATVIVIEHDPEFIRNCDYCIDLGPGGGESGGTIVASGTPEEIRACPQSATGRYL
ncbi:MAG: excinuclease ABC subunit UvrA [Succinivibrionaceae bacterium]|nr:excinuclease ABC subunit UvrA [Succinivibrionaceae bacterium]